MSRNCGEADECDGEHAVYYPLQPGGMCVVRPCHKPFTVPAALSAPAEPQEAAEPVVIAGRYTAYPQRGTPNHCFNAQVFGPDGLSVATFDSTADPRHAYRYAMALADALNAPQPAAQQEPVVTVWQARATHDSKSAWRQVAPTKTESTVEARVEYLKTVRRAGGEPAYEFRALYTSPPQVQRAGLTDEQIDRHSIAAVDCPPSSTVILVSSLRRLLGITATKGGA